MSIFETINNKISDLLSIETLYNPKINQDLLKLSQIVYGGELYFQLNKYKQQEVTLIGSKIKKVNDLVLSQKGNNTFFSYKNEDSGFVACLFENTQNGNLVIAYRGTERTDLGENSSDIITWGKDILTDINLITSNFDEQFSDAWEFYNAVKETYPQKKISITGHSLGGGLSQLVSARVFSNFNIKLETNTFNAPGCKHLLEIFGCKPNLNYSFIKNYSVMNDWCGMFGEKIGESYLLPPIPLKNIDTNIPADILNNMLLTTHEGIFDCSKNCKIIKKPSEFNQQEGLSLWYFDKNNPIKDVDTVPELMNIIAVKFNLPPFDLMGEDLKKAAKNFLKEQNIEIPKVELSKVQEFTEQIKETANNFIEEQKLKIVNIDIPIDSKIVDAWKKTTEDFLSNQSEQKQKFIENINNNIITSLSELLETTMSQVSVNSLKNALKITKKYVKNPEYFNDIEKYISESNE